MRWLPRFRSLWRSEQLDRDLHDELAFHVEMRTREYIANGMTPDEARRAAERQFGNTALIKDRTRDRNVMVGLETWLQDLRYAARSLRKNPAFASIAIAVLALGIGANSAMFSVVNAVMLKPLAYRDPDRLFWLSVYMPRLKMSLAWDASYEIWRRQTQLFESVAAYDDESYNLIDKEPERIHAALVTSTFLPTLGIQPVLGRNISEAEDRPGGPKSAILTHSFFLRKFHGDQTVLGRTLDIDDQHYTIVGVLGPEFRFPESGDCDLLAPLALRSAAGDAPTLIINIVARAKPGITIERAVADLTIVNKGQKNFGPPGTQMRVVPLARQLVGDRRMTLLILLGAVVFVLLIACGNVANLLLGRATARQREVAVRAALGAGRSRLIRQFLTESLLLSLAAAALGLLLARFAIKAVIALASDRVPFIDQTAIDPRVLGFTAGIAILAGIIFGTVPSLAATSLGFFEMLKRGGSSATAPRSHARFRGVLVSAEIALALVLLVGAGLTIRSLWALQTRDLGFQPENVLSADLTPNRTRFDDRAKRFAFLLDFSEKIQNLPGVIGAVYSDRYIMGRFEIEGRPSRYAPTAVTIPPPVIFVPATETFFRALGIRLERGVLFQDRDTQCNVVVNQAVVKAFFPDQKAIGAHVEIPPDGKRCAITGVVSNSSDRGLAENAPLMLYFSMAQTRTNPPAMVSVLLRAPGDPLALTSLLRDQVRAIDRDQPIYNLRTMEQKLSASIAPRRFSMILLSSFAGLALALAIAGIYAVMFASVAERTQEMGIRMALGAERGDVLRLMASQGSRWIAGGLLLGIGGSWAATRLLKAQLGELIYGISLIDPWVFVAVPLLLAATAAIASIVPAMRATRIDPVIALRQE